MSLHARTPRSLVPAILTISALLAAMLPVVTAGPAHAVEESSAGFSGFTDKSDLRAAGRAVVAEGSFSVADGTAPTGSGSTYYVDSVSGSDAADGTSPETAWQSFAHVNGTPFLPGDRILLKAGSTWEADGDTVAKEAYDYTVWSAGRGSDVVGADPTALLSPAGSGTAEAPIVISSYGDGPAPELNGRGVVNDVLQLTNQQHWDISQIEISNVADGFDPTAFRPGTNSGLKPGEENPLTGDLRGIHVQGENAGTLRGFDIHDVFIRDVSGVIWSIGNSGLDRSKRTGGILFEGLKGDAQTVSQFEDVRIRDSYIANTSFANIMFKQFSGMGEYRYQDVDPGWGDRAVAKASSTGVITEDPDWRPHSDIEISGNYLTNRDTQYGWDSVYLTSVQGATVEGNLVDGGGVSGIELYYSDDILVQDNEVAELETRANAADSNGIDPDRGTSNVLIQGNYVHDSGEGILLCGFAFSTAVVRYNVIQDVDRNYVNPHGDSGVNVVYNNLMYNTQKPLKNNTVGFFESSGTASDFLVAKNPHYVMNNVFVNTRADVSGAAFRTTFPGVTFRANAYFGPGVAAPSADAAAISTDPRLGGDPAADIRNAAIQAFDSGLIAGGSPVDLAAIAPGFRTSGAGETDRMPLAVDFFGQAETSPATVGAAGYRPASGAGLVVGTVVDDEGVPVGGASIRTADTTIQATAEGRFALEIAPTALTLTPSAPGYRDGSPTSVTVSEGSTIRQDLVIGATTATTGTISGRVTSSSNSVSGVTVTLSLDGATIADTVTDSGGAFAFADVPAANGYTLTAEKSGFTASSTSDVEVKAARTVSVELRISQERGETVYTIDETFDDEATGAFRGTSDAVLSAATNSAVGSITVVDDAARAGNKYLRIAKTSASSGVLAVYNTAELNLTGTVTIEARLQRTTTTGTPNQIAMYSYSESGWNAANPTASTNPSATFGFSGGKIMTHNVTGSSTVKNAADYVAGRWYTVRNVVDLDNGTFDLFIDDLTTPVLSDQPLRTKVDDLDYFDFFINGSNTGDLLVDYFRVNTGAPYDYADATLAEVTASADGATVELSAGEPDELIGTVGSRTDRVSIVATATSPRAQVSVGGQAAAPGAAVEVALEAGSDQADTWTTQIPIVVTAESGLAETYVVSISRTNPNQSTALRSLSVEGYELVPGFDPARIGADSPYELPAPVPASVSSVTLVFERGWAGQQVQIDGDTIAAEATEAVVQIAHGENTIRVISDSFPGDFGTYVLHITREAPADTSPPVITGLPKGTVNASLALPLAVNADDPESGIRSLEVFLDNVAVPAVGPLSLSGLQGDHVISAKAVNGAGVEATAAETIFVVPEDGAVVKPSSGTLSNTSGWASGLHDGTYSVVMNLWWGTPGSVYRLYENGVLVSTKILGTTAGSSQTIAIPFSGKADGTYVYTGELINSRGTTATSPTTVTVTSAAPGVPILSHDNWDGDGTFTVTANMWWGTNATSYAITLDGVVVGRGDLVAATPTGQVARTSLSSVAVGRHTLQAVFTNAQGSTASEAIELTVSR